MVSDLVTSPPSRQPRLVASLLTVAVVLAALWPLAATYGFWRAGWNGFGASIAALVVCCLAAGISLVMAVAAQRARQPIAGVLGAMAVRMAIPAGALLVVPNLDPAVARSGFGVLLLAYYLAALAVETWVLVRLVPADAANVAKAT